MENDLLKELTAEMKEEKAKMIFMRVFPYLVGAAIILIALFGVNNWWQSRLMAEKMRLGDIYDKAMSLEGENKDALVQESLDYLIANSHTGIKDLALLNKAKLMIAEKNLAKAQEIYENIAASRDCDEISRSYAKIRWMIIELDKKQIDSDKFAQYAAESSDHNQVFWGTAVLLKSLWLIKNGDIEQSKKLMSEALANKDLPNSVRHSIYAILSNF